MKVLQVDKSHGKHPNLYWESVHCDILKSELIVPALPTPANPVTLTIKVFYSLSFADGRFGSSTPGIITRVGDKYFAQDSNGNFFRVKDWNIGAVEDFKAKFQQGQSFWDKKFMLIPPESCSLFDHKVVTAGKEEILRPNILCRFRLIDGIDFDAVGDEFKRPLHLKIDVVRTDGPNIFQRQRDFRSNSKLYDVRDGNTKTLWHELGHAIDEDHIQGLLGDGTCKIEDARGNLDHCYTTPPGTEANIMGKGSGLVLANAKPWVELIKLHTNNVPHVWGVTQNTSLPPRKPNPLFL